MLWLYVILRRKALFYIVSMIFFHSFIPERSRTCQHYTAGLDGLKNKFYTADIILPNAKNYNTKKVGIYGKR